MSPSKQEKLFPRDYSIELMRIAEGDYRTACFLLEGMKLGSIRSENLFLMAHQAIEKSLKAVICAYSEPVPLVHDMGVLVAKLPRESSPEFGYEMTQLSEFATRRRYEEGSVSLTLEEATEVLETAASIVKWASKLVAEKAV